MCPRGLAGGSRIFCFHFFLPFVFFTCFSCVSFFLSLFFRVSGSADFSHSISALLSLFLCLYRVLSVCFYSLVRTGEGGVGIIG